MKPWVFALLLFVGALGVRATVILAFRDIHAGPTGEISNDDVQFNALAVHLVEGYGYKVTPDRPLTSFRAPGFPFVLAAVYATVGFEPAAAYALFALLSAASCVLTYFLAREILTECGARFAGVLAALYLPHAYMASTFLSETVFIFCLALGLLFFVNYVQDRAYWMLALAGLALGYAALTRPGAVLLLPILLGVLAWLDVRDKRVRPVQYVVYPLLFLSVIVPWTVRNHHVHGKWVLIATNGGTTFWGGNNDRVLNERKHLGFWLANTELPDHELILAARNEIERDEIEWRLGKQWVRDHWTSMPLLASYRFARMWWLPDYGEGLRWLRIASYLPFFLLFAVFAFRVSWRRECWSPTWLIVHASTLALLATILVFSGDPRFRDSNMPVLMIYAAAGLCSARHVRSPVVGN